MQLNWASFVMRIVATALAGLLLLPGGAWAKTGPSPSSDSAAGSIAPYLDRVAQEITEFTLQNGLKFIVLERHTAPVVSFLTYADVGGADEPVGQTGVAHYLEHLAFKGTRRIGTTNYEQEQVALDQLDRVAEQLRAAAAREDVAEIPQLQRQFEERQATAAQFIKQNEMGQIVNRFGGVGLNATTSADSTEYFYSFPANKLELWMSLESERFLEPVFREFYKEKGVILEERRSRTDNSPIGTLIEAFLDKAFTEHPYRRPVIGYPQDLQNLSRAEVEAFFKKYYGPSNLTIAVVGDVDPMEVQRLAQIYFGRYPQSAKPSAVSVVEPPQTAERSVTVEFPSQPLYLEGYHRPSMQDPDNVVYDLMASLLSSGRTSRLYKALVEEQQIALAAQGSNGFPGNKFPNLVLFYAVTAPNHTVDEVAQSLRREIDRLKTEPVAIADLERVKKQAQVSLLQTLDSNTGMAQLLTEYEVKTGSWRNLFTELEAIAAVTPQDIQRVAKATFQTENRTVGRLLPQQEGQT